MITKPRSGVLALSLACLVALGCECAVQPGGEEDGGAVDGGDLDAGGVDGGGVLVPPDAGTPSIVANAGPDLTVVHGRQAILDGSGSGPLDGTQTYAWTCSAGALSNAAVARPNYTAPNQKATVTCTLVFTNASGANQASDAAQVAVTNAAPVVSIVGARQTTPTTYELTVPPGIRPRIAARATDADNDPLTFNWTGRVCPCPGGAALNLANANTPVVDFGQNTAGGATYELTLSVSDGVDTTTVTLRISVAPCTFVRAASTCPACGTCGTVACPYASIQAAINAVPAGSAVCVMGDNPPLVYAEALRMRLAVDVIGGYDNNGQPFNVGRTGSTIVRSPPGQEKGVTFGPGANATLQFVTVDQVAAGGVQDSTSVTVDGANARIVNCRVRTLRGTNGVAIRISNSTSTPIAPEIAWNEDIAGAVNPAQSTGTGILVEEVPGGGPVSALIHDNFVIRAGNRPAIEGYGIRIRGASVKAIIQANGLPVPGIGTGFIAGGSAADLGVGIDVVDSVGTEIRGNLCVASENIANAPCWPNWGAPGAPQQRAIGIRLSKTSGTRVEGNQNIHGLFGAAVSVGLIDGDTTAAAPGFTAGSSQNLSIDGNAAILGIGWNRAGYLAAGLVLVGSAAPVIRGNGPVVQWTGPTAGFLRGINGGDTRNTQGAAPYPPSCPGLWLLSTTGALIEDNGVGTEPASCGQLQTIAVGYQEGMPGAPAFAASGTQLKRNRFNSQTTLETAGGWGRCAAAAFYDSSGVAAENNLFAIWYAQEAMGVKMERSGATFMNNFLHVAFPFPLPPFVPQGRYPLPSSLRKRGFDLVDSAASTHLVNNLVYLGRSVGTATPAVDYDNLKERLVLRETMSSGGAGASRLETLAYNLLFEQPDANLGPGNPAYLRLTDGTNATDFTGAQVNAIPGIPAGRNAGNIDKDPILRDKDPGSATALVWRPWDLRLSAQSPAVNAATSTGAPAVDVELDARPRLGAFDIGWDEL